MNTRKFRTKTELINRENKKVDGIWEIALDLGYSAVKLFSPNKVASFPSYAKRIDDTFQFAGQAPKEAIIYKNNVTNEMWLVGEVAQNTITSGDTSDSESSLYGRERYENPMFTVIASCGLGIGLLENDLAAPKDDKIVLETGLPERYMNDKADLIDALAGSYNFSLKLGASDWKSFVFEIDRADIDVMSQPKGTLFSVCMKNDGQFTADARKYLQTSGIVFDPGFGTLDIFPIYEGTVRNGETYSDLGMKRVLAETSKTILEKYKVEIPVPQMQKYLDRGTVRFVDRKKFISKDYPFDDILAASSNMVCKEAIKRMASAINLGDYNYLIITGGTGAAWYHHIEETFKDFGSLTLIKGNQNDDLSFIYSNVRGYYLNRYKKLLKGA